MRDPEPLKTSSTSARLPPTAGVLWACAVGVLLGAVPARADANDDPFAFFRQEALQTTVSRVDEKVDLAPGNVYVYPRSVIKKRGYRSLGELLQTVPGFTVFHRDLEFVTAVRGLAANDNEKVSLLINGQNVNGPHEQSFLNGPINLDNVERVEVVVGPSSLFQQANTLAATVNVITRDAEGVEVIGAAGNDLRYAATVMTGRRWAKDKLLSFSYTTEAKKGFDAWNPGFRTNLAGRPLTGEIDSPSYFSLLRGQYGEWSGQALAYRSAWPELHIANGSRDNDGEMVEEKYSAYAKNEHPWTPDLTSVFTSAASLKEQTRLNRDSPPADAVQQSVKQWVYDGELGLRHTGFDGHRIQTGVQGSYDHNFDTFWTFNSPDKPVGTGAGNFLPKTTLVDEDTYALGFYADDTFAATDRLTFVAGARLDRNTRLRGDRWYPGARAAAIYEPREELVTKLVYNRAVRMPSALSALNQIAGSDHPATSPFFATISPQAQRPEILTTYEWQNVVQLAGARLGLTLYHQELEDFITWFQPHSNGGDFHGNGVELDVQAPLDPCLTIWANAAWNDSKLDLFNDRLFGSGASGVEQHHSYVNPSGRIIGSAKYTANLGVDWKVLETVTFSPGARYFAHQAAVDHDSNSYIYVHDRIYLDAALTWDHVRGEDVDVRLSGHNLLDDRRRVGSPLNGDTYRPRGVEGVLTVTARFATQAR